MTQPVFFQKIVPGRNPNRKNIGNVRRNQSELINELTNRHIIRADEVQDGTLENILQGLKNEPYRSTSVFDGTRKSFRRQQGNVTFPNSSSRETEDL